MNTRTSSPTQAPGILAGSANPHLAQAIARHLGVPLVSRVIERFPDGELHVEVQENVRGCDLYLVQPTSPPAEAHLLELLFLADACRRAGAASLTAVLPYFGYARQDRRARGGEALGARLIAGLLEASGFQRVVAMDLHTAALEGFFSIELEHLSAVPVLADAVQPDLPEDAVVVAPDLGAAKLADRYAQSLDRPVALVHKTRISGEVVRAGTITGDVRGRTPLLVDDMISTGGTIEAAVNVLLAAGCQPEITVVASHGLFVGPAAERLSDLPVRRLVVTDSISLPAGFTLPVQVHSVAPIVAEAIKRIHYHQSLRDLVARAA
ncbi:MAG: ribose-phosphate pyrophosphokinase [Chloroflexi bacterium]|nr:ribose-phosphate pyrophosphokinase [Chloroflexota bacterium]